MPDSTVGFGEEMMESLRRFTAETHAGHLLPHLRPGLRVWTSDAAPAIYRWVWPKQPARVSCLGVDMEESQIDLARSLAVSAGTDNAIFHVGDVMALPFPDGFFDVAHCHDVLMYVRDTRAALAEVKRVLKPGGLIACREMICSSSFVHPDMGIMKTGWNALEDLLTFDDGHPQMGKEMKTHILEAGFMNIRVSGSFGTHSSPSDVALIHSLARQWFSPPEVLKAASVYAPPGMSRSMWDRLSTVIDEWKDLPDAAVAYAYGEAIANKP